MDLKEYSALFWKKCLDNLASVKVWIFMLPFIMSTIFMGWIISENVEFIQLTMAVLGKDHPSEYKAIIDSFAMCVNSFTSWCTFTVALGSMVIGVREVFKVQKLKALANGSSPEAKEEIKNLAA